jgi:hypothetical protein
MSIADEPWFIAMMREYREAMANGTVLDRSK